MMTATCYGASLPFAVIVHITEAVELPLGHVEFVIILGSSIDDDKETRNSDRDRPKSVPEPLESLLFISGFNI